MMQDSTYQRNPEKLTESVHNNQHLYFTTQSITNDNECIVFISDRSGSPNLWVMERESGQVHQLSEATELMRSYVYPTGAVTGFSKVSPCLDPASKRVYWVQDNAVCTRGLENGARSEQLATIPSGWWTGYCALSSDGRKICVPCTDPGAFSSKEKTQHEQLRSVPWRMLRNGLKTRLYVFDTQNGAGGVYAELPFWVTHVQFDPNDDRKMICNCEGSVGSNAKKSFPYRGRIWKVDENRRWSRVYLQKNGETANHENWAGDGSAIVYHGKEGWRSRGEALFRLVLRILRKAKLVSSDRLNSVRNDFVAARTWHGELVFQTRVPFPVSHAVATEDTKRIVVDSRDGFVYTLSYRENQEPAIAKVCYHGSTMSHQDAHPHPRMTPDGNGMLFTSDVNGVCDIFEVRL